MVVPGAAFPKLWQGWRIRGANPQNAFFNLFLQGINQKLNWPIFSKLSDGPWFLVFGGVNNRRKGLYNWFSRHLHCPDKGFTSSSHPITCFVLRHHVDGVQTVVHPCGASQNWNRSDQVCCDHGHGGVWGLQTVTYIFLPPTQPHLGCLETLPSTWV